MTTHASDQSSSQARRAHDGFDTLDACHHEMLQRVGELELLVEQLEQHGIDPQARTSALAIVRFFATTAREHHEDEERHVFPPLVQSGDPEVVQAVLRLQQDHSWLEEDWLELSPHVQSVAAGYNGYDIDVLREGCTIFAALVRDHIALEEAYIYPQARKRMPLNERRDMGREMAARRRAERGERHAR